MTKEEIEEQALESRKTARCFSALIAVLEEKNDTIASLEKENKILRKEIKKHTGKSNEH